MVWATPMRWPWLGIWLAVSLACNPSSDREAEDAPPAPIAKLTRALGEAGVPVRAERLRSLREFPGCEEAELRYRLHFEGGFVNVSRFRAPLAARACRGEFRATVQKAGERAWEQMRGDITTQGPWLFFFPPDRPSAERRAAVLAVLRQAGGAAQK